MPGARTTSPRTLSICTKRYVSSLTTIWPTDSTYLQRYVYRLSARTARLFLRLHAYIPLPSQALRAKQREEWRKKTREPQVRLYPFPADRLRVPKWLMRKALDVTAWYGTYGQCNDEDIRQR